MKFRFRFSLRTFLIAATIFWPVYFVAWRITAQQGVQQLVTAEWESEHRPWLLPGLSRDTEMLSPAWSNTEYWTPVPFVVCGDVETHEPDGSISAKVERHWHLWFFGRTRELPFTTAGVR